MGQFTWIKSISEGTEGRENSPSKSPVYVRDVPSTYSKLLSKVQFNFPTLYDIFSWRSHKTPTADYLGRRQGSEYTYTTYQETEKQIAKLATAFDNLGVKKGARVGIYGVNSPEYMITLWACFRQGFVAVPLYDSLGEEALEYIVKQAEIECVIVQTLKAEKLQDVISKVSGVTSAIQGLISKVIIWGEGAEQKANLLNTRKVITFQDALSKSSNTIPPAVQTANDLVMVMYTSGTTGAPKGVCITNKNLISMINTLALILAEGGVIEDNQEYVGKTFFSFLPLAHILDLAVELTVCYVGLRIGYSQGNPKLILDDLKTCKPHIFVSVPRVLDRAYSGFFKRLQGMGTVGFLIEKILYPILFHLKLISMKLLKVPVTYAFPPFDYLIGNKIQQMLGGNLLLVACGGAALPYKLEMWGRISFNCAMFQGYGLTETCCGGALCSPYELSHAGTIGPVAPLVQLRLESIQEMGYDANGSPPRGEILIRGDCVSSGYYKNEEQTRDAFESDGWFHSGDVGELDSTGCVRIIDRKKNIFKIAQGEYIASEKLENTYGTSHLVEQIWIYGNSYETQLVAIIVPDKNYIEKVAQQEGIQGSYNEILQDQKIKEIVQKSLGEAGAKAKVKGFERISAVHLSSETFNAQNGLTTPTLKLKRPALQKAFQKTIDQMYKDLNKSK